MHRVENGYLDVHIYSTGRTIEDTLGKEDCQCDDATKILGYLINIISRDILDVPPGTDCQEHQPHSCPQTLSDPIVKASSPALPDAGGCPSLV